MAAAADCGRHMSVITSSSGPRPGSPGREILCTIGPASLNERVLGRLQALGVSLLRINLSHTRLEDLPRVVATLRAHSRLPICLDSEGAQVRTGDFAAGLTLREGSTIRLHRSPGSADDGNLHFQPEEAYELLQPGDLISIDFHAALVQVVDKGPQAATLRVLHGGPAGPNKAVTVERRITLPALTRKDRAALAWGRGNGIRHVALSFANRGEDVDAVRAIVGADTFLISKIECSNALAHVDAIAVRSDALLIDRGDLSREEPIERIPALQKAIIARGKAAGRKVYVATNLLESMITSPRPTRAEVNDVVNTLLDGADGLVLAAETAIGRHPVDCVGMVVRLIHEFERHRLGQVELGAGYRPAAGLSFLPDPLDELTARGPEDTHGARLTPLESRLVFQHKGWHRVIAVDPWAAPPSEATLRAALDAVQADGLLLRQTGTQPEQPALAAALAGRVLVTHDAAAAPAHDAASLLRAARRARQQGCSHLLVDPALPRPVVDAALADAAPLGLQFLSSSEGPVPHVQVLAA